jgi:putative ABC transport system permease protein
VEPLGDTVTGEVRPALLVLLGAVALVLLIGCANAANLLLARGAARRRELAIRTALGASRWRLVRQLMTESTLLSVAAGTIGLVLAWWGIDALMALTPGNVGQVRAIGVSGRVLAFAVGLSLATGVVFGLLPALALSRTRLVEPMQGTAPPLRMRARGLLVVGEVGLAFLLLCGAGLLVRSFDRLANVDPGFATRGVVTMSVTLPAEHYADGARIGELWRSLDERLKSRPEATAAGLTTHLPLAGWWQIAISIQGRPPARPDEMPSAYNWVVTPGYFRAMGIRLREGRVLEPTDDGRRPVVVVSRGFAARFWPGQTPLGKRIKWGPAESPRPWLEVVGVVDDVRGDRIQGAGGPDVYMPPTQLEPGVLVLGARSMTIVAKAAGSPQALLSALRDEVRSLDPRLAPARPAPLDDVLASAVAEPRFRTQLIGMLATIAMLLASIGIYGVVAFAVAQRTREIGIRMALGARRAHVVGMVARQGLGLAAAGVAVGVALSVALTRLLSAFLDARVPQRVAR